MEREAGLRDSIVERYSFLWGTIECVRPAEAYHYRWLKGKLSPGHLHGMALDAGCGPGIDAAHMAQDGAARVIALDPSDGGMLQARVRATGCPNLHPVQGRLERLPFPSHTFDFVYCYGVLHHLVRPEAGFSELVRVLKPHGVLAIYVYEDFGKHTAIERGLLRLVTAIRRRTVRWPPRVLSRWCQFTAPFVFAAFTLPAQLFAAVPLTRPLSRQIPFRHAESPRRLIGDLAGFDGIHVLPHRGWLAHGRKRD